MRRTTLGAVLALLLGAASSAQATMLVLEACVTGQCGAVLPGSNVTLQLEQIVNAAPPPGDVLAVDIWNNTNGDIDLVRLDYLGPPPSSAAFRAFDDFSGFVSGFTISVGDVTDAGFSFNITFDFPAGRIANRFNPGEHVHFEVVSNPPIAPAFGNATAHVFSLRDCTGLPGCGGSVKLAVPDAGSSLGMLALGLLCLGGLASRSARR